MNKYISLILILLLFMFSTNLIITIPVYAESEAQASSSRKTFVNMTKGAIALYLLSKVANIISDQYQHNQNQRQNKKEVADKFSSIRDSSHINDKIIIIDPGHGGYDPGAVGPGGLEEKAVNLDIALQLYNLLKHNTEAKVYLTRNDDRFVSLAQRSAMANRLNADIFISIHSNADEEGIEKGIETYAYHTAPKKTWALAWYLHESLVKELQLEDRALKTDSFHVIRETTNMNSVLLEIGYISHYKEEVLLSNVEFRGKAAKAIYNGILNYHSSL